MADTALLVAVEPSPMQTRRGTQIVRAGRRPAGHVRWRGDAIVIALGSVLPLAAVGAEKGLGVATSDDWSYLAAAASLAQHGTINLHHWGTVFELGQLFAVAPLYLAFGVHPVLAILCVWCLGIVGLASLAALARRLGVPTPARCLILATLCLCPLFFGTDATFLTDIPAFALMTLSLALWAGCEGPVRYDRRRLAALAVALVAFTVREPAGLVALPVLLEPIVTARRDGDLVKARRLVIAAAVLLVVLGVVWKWRQAIPTTGYEAPIRLSIGPFVQNLAGGMVPGLFGFFLLPVVVAARPWRLIRHMRLTRPVSTFVVTLACFVVPMLGESWTARFEPANLGLGNFAQDDFMPDGLRALCAFVGLASCTVAVLVMVGAYQARGDLSRQERRLWSGVGLFSAAYLGFVLVCRLLGEPLWDRYLLIVVAMGALAVWRGADLMRAALARRGELGTAAERSVSIWRPAVVACVIVLGLYGAAQFSDNAALMYGWHDFSTQEAQELRISTLDVNDGWVFAGSAYAASAGPTLTTRAGVAVTPADDGGGSFFYIYKDQVGECSTYAVTANLAEAEHRHIIATSPGYQGLFVTFHFVLFKTSVRECVAHANDQGIPLPSGV